MTDDTWRDRLVGARMTVDQEFQDRIQASSFSTQQWSLIMTAIEFDIVDADDPDDARIVANTDDLDAIIPELDQIEEQMSGMAGGPSSTKERGGGVLGTIKSALGLESGNGASGTPGQREEAVELATAYAERLQTHLEDEGRWTEIRELAASA